jgi:GNAT superfamily N-acetyltransferase
MGTEDWTIRVARPEETGDLTALMGRALAHWGHDVRFPDLVARALEEDAVTPAYLRDGEVWVLVDEGGATRGFHALTPRRDDVDLTHMMLEPAVIGAGCGRLLWDHAVGRARDSGRPRMRILSDPEAVGFYTAMGAWLERRVEVADGFVLGVMWFDL